MFLCSSTGGLVMMGAELPKNWYEYLQKNWYWLGTGRRSCVQLGEGSGMSSPQRGGDGVRQGELPQAAQVQREAVVMGRGRDGHLGSGDAD